MNNKYPKKGYGFIYKYTSPSGKSYIGQTIYSLAERAGHNGKKYMGCPLFYNAIKKYGFENFEVEILAEAKEELLDDLEVKYIQIFDTYNNGYNKTLGGKNTFSPRERRKIYQYSAETGELIKEWEDYVEVEQAFNTTLQTLEGCLNNLTYTQYGYCWSYLKMDKFPINERIVNPKSKEVRQYDMQDNLIATYKSIADAARAIGHEEGRSNIKKCCRHDIKMAYGFRWECSEIISEKKFNNTAKQILKIDPNSNKVIEVFPSISSAAKSLGKETALIRRVLDKDKNTAYGFKWKTAQGSTTKDS